MSKISNIRSKLSNKLYAIMNPLKVKQDEEKPKRKKKKRRNMKTFIEPTMENLGYLQEIYERNKSAKARQREKEEQMIRIQNDRWWVKYICVCMKVKLDDDEDEGEEIKETRYSSGNSNASDVVESDVERSDFDIRDKEQRVRRAKYLWLRMMSKVKGAVLVLVRFGELEKRINLFGTSTKFDF